MKPAPVVVALVVSHNGARWLPQVIDGLAAQRVRPRRVVAVDTGSKDNSRDLLTDALGANAVIATSSSTTFPAAVAMGVDAAAEADWIWILHDDSTPHPGALAALLGHLDGDREVDIVGPKLREWPSLRRLQEVGVTMSGTGRRETGLERGEYDQGQHDRVREVLAVHSAGMLIRRSVFVELGGFERSLPIFGNDLDLGWRAARAGFRTVVVPAAIVFHAEAAHRGVRRTPLTGRHTHYAERRAALFTLLANVPARALPFQALRILMGSLLRVLGFLMVRSVGPAFDELAAVVSLYAHPWQLRRARKQRRPLTGGDPERVRRLLAPWWVPYRHGLDFLSDLAAAATLQAQDVAERRRMARLAADELTARGSRGHRIPVAGQPTDRRRRPRGAESTDGTLHDDELPELSPGLLTRFLTSPVALAVVGFLLMAMWGVRAGLTGRFAEGSGALSPAPNRAADWWQLYVEAWHPIAQGTAIPAPPYVLPFALSTTLLPVGPTGVVAGLMVLSTPLAFWGAWRLLRVVGHLLDERGMPAWLLAIASAAYSLLGVTSGAWGAGRFGVVASVTMLPWLAHAALGFADPSAQRRWRAGWRTGFLLTILVCFTPVLWLLAFGVGAVIVGLALALAPRSVRAWSAWGPPAVALAVPWALLVPWWIPLLAQGAAAGLLLEAGQLPFDTVAGSHLAVGRIADGGAPLWVGAIIPALAVLALVLPATRLPVLICWIVAATAVVLAIVINLLTLSLPTGPVRSPVGVFSAFVAAVAIVAVAMAVQGLTRHPRSAVLRGAGMAMAALTAMAPLAGLLWALTSASDSVQGPQAAEIPAYMTQNATRSPGRGVLVVRGSVASGLSYLVRREDGDTLGEDEIAALAPVDKELTAVVRKLASVPTPEVVG
ncbi:MAG: glycosyltransferase, partial [Nocardioides sp.]